MDIFTGIQVSELNMENLVPPIHSGRRGINDMLLHNLLEPHWADVMQADFTVASNTTPVATPIRFPVFAGELYLVEMLGGLDNNNLASVGYKWNWSVPGTATGTYMMDHKLSPVSRVSAPWETAQNGSTTIGSTVGFFSIWGHLIASETGFVDFLIAQDSSSINPVILRDGTFVRVSRVVRGSR